MRQLASEFGFETHMEESTTRISYCTQWSRHGKHPYHVISEVEARRRHKSGELYTAVLADGIRPRCFLEFSGAPSVCVEFLDEALRTYFHYSFQEKRPKELFISMSRRPEFPNDFDEPDRATVLYFETDGRLVIVRYVANADGIGSKIVSEEEQIVDVSRNWEPCPEFGQYQGLATLDRGTPLPSSPLKISP
jgi:hypothetical protein